MSEIPGNQSKTASGAFSYFVLSYCLLVPTIGTLASIILLDQMNEELALAGTACVYLSSIVLGSLNIKRFRKNYERAEFWALIVGIILSGLSCLVAVAVLILHRVAVGLRIIS